MRVRIERTYLATASGTRVAVERTDRTTVEAESLPRALPDFIHSGGGRLWERSVSMESGKPYDNMEESRVSIACIN